MKKKLMLKKITITNLRKNEQSQVLGGVNYTNTCKCPTKPKDSCNTCYRSCVVECG